MGIKVSFRHDMTSVKETQHLIFTILQYSSYKEHNVEEFHTQSQTQAACLIRTFGGSFAETDL